MKFENVFLCLGNNLLKMSDSISNSNSWRILIYAPDFVSFFKDVFGNPVDWFDQIIFSNTSTIHKQNARNNACA